MDDLIAFLRARYDEREAKAKDALPGPWIVEEHTYETVVTSDGGKVVASIEGLRDGWHIADNDPTFVLADVAAKRLLLDGHEPERGAVSWDDNGNPLDGTFCAACSTDDCREAWPCRHVRLLALPFAGHPDYREAWRS